MNSEVRELVEYAGSFSDAVAIHENGHVKVVKGKLMVILPATPSDHRWRKNAITSLRKNGLIDRDPRAKTPSISAEARERARETIQARTLERRRRLDTLHIKGKHTLTSVGVWKLPRRGTNGGNGSVAEAARVAWWWSGLPSQDKLWRPSSVEAARNQWVSFYKADAILDDKTLDWIEAFLDDLNIAPVARSRYHLHLMESQKVTVTRHGEVDLSAIQPAPQLERSSRPDDPLVRGMTEKGVTFAFELATYTTANTPEDRVRLIEMLERVARRCG